MAKKHPKDMTEHELTVYMDELMPLLEKLVLIMNFPDWKCHFAIVLKIKGRPAQNVKTEFDIDPDGFVKDGAYLVIELFEHLIWIDDNKLNGERDPLLSRMKNEMVKIKAYFETKEFLDTSKNVFGEFIGFMRNVKKRNI